MNLKYIRKRDGSRQNFSSEKITQAIKRALGACHLPDHGGLSDHLTSLVIRRLKQMPGKYPGVEQVQDMVEQVLMENNLPQVASAYIRYREKRRALRESKAVLGVEDHLKLSVTAIAVLKQRYLLRQAGQIIETPEQLFRRVAHHVAQAERDFSASVSEYEEKFYQLMRDLVFLPNSPTLMNAGTPLGQLSACFVLPVEDSLGSIFESLRNMALIHQSGGGTGFSFSRLRPKGDLVSTTQGEASGPLSFMEIFDAATSVVKQGGRRRGANMAVLTVDHPDILEFIAAKRTGRFANFNLSVALTDDFLHKVIKRQTYCLINPRTRKSTRKLPAAEVFDMIAQSAWETGDPGLIFIDVINRENPVPAAGRLEACNPCGEQPLLPYESCNLGSLNLTKFVKKTSIDWNKLSQAVQLAVRFLDDVIEVNRFPLPQVEKITKANRKIGLGVMGWADTLALLGIPYGSEKSFKLAEELMAFINREAFVYSSQLGQERGSFPNFSSSRYTGKVPALRNATRTTIAPTGTLSIIANCSSGIEPFFGLAFTRRIMDGQTFLEINPVWEKAASQAGLLKASLLRQLLTQGSLQGISGVPESLRRIFLTTFDLSPKAHLLMQAAFQKHTNNAVSKTVNLPASATISEVKKVFLLAWKLGCKGITVFRYGSKTEQVLYLGKDIIESEDHLPAMAVGCQKQTCEF
ncbi:MAG: adenosylcobalamin-dependent ribonucleoside-diphosphate reductase [Candidatus Omnitrophica bacterium]|nr:adenosylcobalamin-dependent ribonucleoside-diphosphate reductase [Candidatus Omnitrophota bacterium]